MKAAWTLQLRPHKLISNCILAALCWAASRHLMHVCKPQVRLSMVWWSGISWSHCWSLQSVCCNNSTGLHTFNACFQVHVKLLTLS